MIEAGCQLADIRDEQSYAMSHIPSANHLDNQGLQQFIEQAEHLIRRVVSTKTD